MPATRSVRRKPRRASKSAGHKGRGGLPVKASREVARSARDARASRSARTPAREQLPGQLPAAPAPAAVSGTIGPPSESEQLAFHEFLMQLSAGARHGEALQAAGLVWRAVSIWLYMSPWFQSRYDRAREIQSKTRGTDYEDILDDRIRNGTAYPIYCFGEKVGEGRTYSDRLLLAGLGAHSPKFKPSGGPLVGVMATKDGAAGFIRFPGDVEPPVEDEPNV